MRSFAKYASRLALAGTPSLCHLQLLAHWELGFLCPGLWPLSFKVQVLEAASTGRGSQHRLVVGQV